MFDSECILIKTLNSILSSGPALLALHGLPGRRGRWEEMGYNVGPLAERFIVVSLDLRGNGASNAPSEPPAYTMERIVGDVVAVADVTGAEQFALWGFSWGASATLQMAACSPRVRRSVTLGGYFGDVYDAEWVLPIIQDWRELADASEQGRLAELVKDAEERAFFATTHPRAIAACFGVAAHLAGARPSGHHLSAAALHRHRRRARGGSAARAPG
jgi:pimeloyl-ACP methyl ester carboxylesterase